jgi:enamine deaminase RidA (YjgF/YER057c/UK114 family)
MPGTVDARLAELGLTLPAATAPAANYIPFVQTGNLVFVSGQVSMAPEGLVKGVLGVDMDVEAGAAAARVCALNLIAHLKTACGGDLDRVVRVVKLLGFVNAGPGFDQQPAVINGASNLLVDVFGDKGRHARSAVGASLPFGAAVEVEGIFEIA